MSCPRSHRSVSTAPGSGLHETVRTPSMSSRTVRVIVQVETRRLLKHIGFSQLGKNPEHTSFIPLEDKEHLLIRRQRPQVISDHRLEQIGSGSYCVHRREQTLLRVLSMLF